MAFTDVPKVKLTIGTTSAGEATVLTDAAITNYILFAEADVTRAIALSTDFANLGAAEHGLIASLLGAHYCAALGDRRSTKEIMGDAEVDFQSKIDFGYDLTHYGQMALRRDPTGTLKGISKNASAAAGATVLGPG